MKNRRQFLRAALGGVGAAASLGVFPPVIRRALAIPPKSATGTIQDVRHVVILMQENRSFDHYFGTLRGVRGFADRHPVPLPGGLSVWDQADDNGTVYRPFRLDSRTTCAQRVPDLVHGWRDAQAAANQGRWNRWVPSKALSLIGPELPAKLEPRPGLTMGFYRREDIPFQFALADAFTVCDAYHCSIFGSTTPNRLFQMAGSNDPLGRGGGPVIDNRSGATLVENRDGIADPGSINAFKLPPEYRGFGPRYTYKTYPERLQEAGVSWKVYQDPADNMDGFLNALVAFEAFSAAPRSSALWQRGMSRWTLEDLRRDVLADTLPQVCWVTPPAAMCEHPFDSSPVQGAEFIAQLLAALTANPDVWGGTALLICFDENDGFFDHVPSPAPPAVAENGVKTGASTVDTSAELHSADQSHYGLGPRVPLYVISPWSKGGWVDSQVFDHTSLLRFLELRFGVMEPNISPWRRVVCGDLTSAFDFANPDRAAFISLPDTTGSRAVVQAQNKLPVPAAPQSPQPLFQEPGTRASRALPYELQVEIVGEAEGELELRFSNTGTAGAVFHVYDKLHLDRIPRRYTVGPRQSLQDVWNTAPEDAARYHLWIYGPNGFVRELRGDTTRGNPRIALRYDRTGRTVRILIRNPTPQATLVYLRANAYHSQEPVPVPIEANSAIRHIWSVAEHGGWYDITVSGGVDALYEYRFAGRMETGEHSISDPAMRT